MTPLTLALDIGATKVIIGLVGRGRVIFTKRYNTVDLLSKDGDLTSLIFAIKKYWRPNIKNIAIGFAGPIKNGVVERNINFSVDAFPNHFPLAEKLEKKLEVAVIVNNDAQCFAVGEAIYGVGRRYREVVGLTLGSGLGGGVVIDGELYEGANELAGEFGHLPFPTSNVLCGCGQVGHLETILSGAGLARIYEESTGKKQLGETIFKLASKGDKNAQKSIQTVEEALVHLLLTIMSTWNPGAIVVGGGLSSAPRLLVRARRRARLLAPFQAFKRTIIAPSILHDQAILLGATYLASKRT